MEEGFQLSESDRRAEVRCLRELEGGAVERRWGERSAGRDAVSFPFWGLRLSGGRHPILAARHPRMVKTTAFPGTHGRHAFCDYNAP